MSFEAIVASAVGVLAVCVLGFVFNKKRPKRVKIRHYSKRWKDIQKLCPSKETWPQAVIEADNLLDDVLKKRRYKGSSMGERLVEAQKIFTDNDSVWYAHKLRKKIEAEPSIKLKKAEVKDALFGIRQGLKDLRAL
jgi:hypothetical protein